MKYDDSKMFCDYLGNTESIFTSETKLRVESDLIEKHHSLVVTFNESLVKTEVQLEIPLTITSVYYALSTLTIYYQTT